MLSTDSTYLINYTGPLEAMDDDARSNSLTDPSMGVGQQQPQSFCLFLGDISLFCSETDLANAFRVFGELVDVRIKKNKTTKRNLSYGFVEYTTYQSAVAAINEMNGKLFCGRVLKVIWAETPPDTPKESKGQPQPGFAKIEETKSVSVYVSFKSIVPKLIITDESLRVVYSPFGEIVDVSIRQSMVDPLTGLQRGYAFVCFATNDAGIQAALNAASAMGDCCVDGVRYTSEVSKSLKSRLSAHQMSSRQMYSSSPSTIGAFSQQAPFSIGFQSSGRPLLPHSVSQHQQQMAFPVPPMPLLPGNLSPTPYMGMPAGASLQHVPQGVNPHLNAVYLQAPEGHQQQRQSPQQHYQVQAPAISHHSRTLGMPLINASPQTGGISSPMNPVYWQQQETTAQQLSPPFGRSNGNTSFVVSNQYFAQQMQPQHPANTLATTSDDNFPTSTSFNNLPQYSQQQTQQTLLHYPQQQQQPPLLPPRHHHQPLPQYQQYSHEAHFRR